MSIYINKDTKVITQGITGKTGQFHTEKCQEYANGKNCFVAGVNPKKAGESIFNIPIYASVKEAATQTGAESIVVDDQYVYWTNFVSGGAVRRARAPASSLRRRCSTTSRATTRRRCSCSSCRRWASARSCPAAARRA